MATLGTVKGRQAVAAPTLTARVHECSVMVHFRGGITPHYYGLHLEQRRHLDLRMKPTVDGEFEVA